MSSHHGGPRPRLCAGGGTLAAVVITTLVVVGVYRTYGSPQRYMYVTRSMEPIAIMRVQKYAGSRIKSGSC